MEMFANVWNDADSLRKLSHLLMLASLCFAIFAAATTGFRYYVDRRAGQLAKVPFEYTVIPGSDTTRAYLNMSPVKLWSDIEKLPPPNADKLKESYDGRWIAFRAPISSITTSIEPGFIDFDNGQMKIRMSMAPGQMDVLKTLHKGAVVSIEGKFNVVWDGYSNFTESELRK